MKRNIPNFLWVWGSFSHYMCKKKCIQTECYVNWSLCQLSTLSIKELAITGNTHTHCKIVILRKRHLQVRGLVRLVHWLEVYIQISIVMLITQMRSAWAPYFIQWRYIRITSDRASVSKISIHHLMPYAEDSITVLPQNFLKMN